MKQFETSFVVIKLFKIVSNLSMFLHLDTARTPGKVNLILYNFHSFGPPLSAGGVGDDDSQGTRKAGASRGGRKVLKKKNNVNKNKNNSRKNKPRAAADEEELIPDRRSKGGFPKTRTGSYCQGQVCSVLINFVIKYLTNNNFKNEA